MFRRKKETIAGIYLNNPYEGAKWRSSNNVMKTEVDVPPFWKLSHVKIFNSCNSAPNTQEAQSLGQNVTIPNFIILSKTIN